MSIPFIDLKAQYHVLREKIKSRIDTVLDHGQYIMGPEIFELESVLCNYTGAKHCITVSSGTEALLISLMSLGVGRGDEVITTPFSFIATAEVIALLGATPVYVDIEPDTCNINADLIERKLSERTKAIMPVSLYGQPPDMDSINAIAKKYGGIPVIEDGAQSFGATYHGRKSCNLSTFGCTSFFPSKPLGCYGDGGAIFTNSDDLAQICRELRVHGQRERYVHSRIGVGGRLDTIQAAILLAKMENFESELETRAINAGYYDTQLAGLGIEKVSIRSSRTSVYAQYTIFSNNRSKLIENLGKHNIPTAIHYPLPIDQQSAYSTASVEKCDIAFMRSNQVLSLPMSPWLSFDQIDTIVNVLKHDFE